MPVLSQTDKAYSALSKLKALSVDYDRPLDEAEAEVLLSITDWISGNKKEAQIKLLQVMYTLEPFGFVRVIANEGKAVLPILSAIIKKWTKATGPQKIYSDLQRKFISLPMSSPGHSMD